MDEQTQVPPAQPPVEPNPPSSSSEHTSTISKPRLNKWVALVVFVVVLGGAAAGAYYLQKKAPPISNNQPTPGTPVPPPPVPEPFDSNPPVPYSYTPKGQIVNASIDWHYPTVAYLDVFDGDDYIRDASKFYEIGTFKDSTYKGKKLFVGIIPCNSMCPNVVLQFAGDQGGSERYAIIESSSDPLDNFDEWGSSVILSRSRVIVDVNVRIPQQSPPQTVSGPNNQKLNFTKPGFFNASYNVFNATNLKHVFTDPRIGNVYTSPDDTSKVDPFFRNFGFYVQAPDWNTWIYTPDAPNFVDDKDVPQVTWSGDAKNSAVYVYQSRTGCGTSNYADVVNGINIQNDLVVAGMTNKGEIIYELKNTNHSILKDIYDNKYNPYNETKVSYSEFLKRHPAFFWIDPFNRLIKFEHIDFQPMAECAKPAIYLYPETTSNVSVKVAPQGGFTYTDPEYGTGWNVTAHTDGRIVVDGKEYPYLFWEGRGGLYQTPDRGFIVAQTDVYNFLVEKLAKLGLNQKETADFMEYWEPYMQGYPYYFITFMGNQALDDLAPLEVIPKPDTVIRVLMDFKPLDKPIEVQGFEIRTPERKGFTVVEWGGVKH